MFSLHPCSSTHGAGSQHGTAYVHQRRRVGRVVSGGGGWKTEASALRIGGWSVDQVTIGDRCSRAPRGSTRMDWHVDEGSGCSASFDEDIGAWDTSGVDKRRWTTCFAFDQDLGWDGSVMKMERCSACLGL